jgi:hypothetical protein
MLRAGICEKRGRHHGGYHRSGRAQLFPFSQKSHLSYIHRSPCIHGRRLRQHSSIPSFPRSKLSLELVCVVGYTREAMAERALLAKRAQAFAPSSIQQLSLLAQRCNAINLAEGGRSILLRMFCSRFFPSVMSWCQDCFYPFWRTRVLGERLLLTWMT